MYIVILTGHTFLLVYTSAQGEKKKIYLILWLIMINRTGSLGLVPEDSLSRPNGNTVPF